ncbi:FAD:protein FMN transferase [Undibacterium sp. Jales W-56]|uniref:FAD:protein FMN transferase n=1 Tax=Undibacterium sp. Jales W-56 TaxID=2897325 RepID=UPI0021D1279E|nr:FAD:protein FMN transferase [Undibacterium sp. Jales W-56]MCU6434388.1 FAD:protein FMN transferase [Undibacterium sp. Jales W-56]
MKRRAQPWLGTLVDIGIADTLDEMRLQAAFGAAFQRIALIHQLMSFHAPDSELTRINRAEPGSLLSIHPHTYTVLSAAQRLTQASKGLFDIRIASRLMAWDLLPRMDEAARSLLPYQPQAVAYELLPDHRLKKLRQDWLDLGGVAKGYAVDQAIAALQECGIRDACVNAGGDLRVIGDRPVAIGLRHPADPTRSAHTVSLQNAAMATSATYFSQRQLKMPTREQAIEYTGAPASIARDQTVSALVHGISGAALTDLGSVSVRAAECLWADGLTKVVAASGNAQHPCLAEFAANAFIIDI